MVVLVAAAAATTVRADDTPAASAAWRPVVTGQLKNGVRYAILPRTGKEPGIGLLLRNAGGFIAERRPGERGLAHLIEHIVFASPVRAAPDDLHHFPRIGLPLTFPAPTAGSTSWRESNYFLSTRTTRPVDLDTLLGLFREAVGDLTFRADAVDGERASVMREMADKKSGNAIFADYIAAVAPGSPNDVIDAQNSDDVPTASIATLRALYHRLYQPRATMIVVVGNVDVGQTRALIERRFGDWTATGPTAVPAPPPMIHADRIAPVSVSSQAGGRRTALVTVTMPTPAVPRTRQRQAEVTLMDLLAVRAVGDRLAAAQSASPPGKVGAFIENGDPGFRQIMLWDNFTGDQWRPALSGVRSLTCRLVTVGFSAPEWAAARTNVIRDLDQRSANMADMANVELAKDLSHAVADGRDLIPPDELLRHARAWLPTVSVKDGNRWWRRQWRAGPVHVRVEGPELAAVPDAVGVVRAVADQAADDAGCGGTTRG
ncbi:hypothetical protein ASE75_13955 [Sphingomonas sp. Leaf17]|nr:hypothetical protein ASE75_13955 [Sphingomonas sp. Leaf17]